MAKPKRIIVVSDLHLGRGFEQDDFRNPGEQLVWRDAVWEFFCRSIKKITDGEPTLLILNGDIIDLWEIAHESELEGPTSAAAITARIHHPADTLQKEADATAIGVWQVEEACDHHRGFVRGLKLLLAQSNISVRYHAGNHDHGMLNPGLQQALRGVLGADASSESKLSFGLHYRSEDLRAYIEHGNQFSGEDSFYENVEDWREEAPGYYALRYIWNRFQHRYAANKPSLGEALAFVIAVLKREAKSQQQRETFQFVIDYFIAWDTGVVPASGRITEFPLGSVFGVMYDAWKQAGKPTVADDFFRKQMQEAMAQEEPDSEGMPGELVNTGLKDSRYTQGLMDRFSRKAPGFPKLQFTKDVLLTIGHTHKPGRQMLFEDSFRKNIYINSGTWTRDLVRPTYVMIGKRHGDPEMGLFEIK